MAMEVAAMVRPEVLAHRIRSIHRVDVADALRACAVPILYLRGDHDRLVPASALHTVLRARPDARVATVRSPHMVLQTQPAACALAIEEFLASVGSA